jgi:hypothetical protein
LEDGAGENGEAAAALVAIELLPGADPGDALGAAVWTLDSVGPSNRLEIVAAPIVGAELLDQVGKVHVHLGGSVMGRPRKHPKDWTTEEAIRKLFPRRVVSRLKKEAETAARESSEKPATKRKS